MSASDEALQPVAGPSVGNRRRRGRARTAIRDRNMSEDLFDMGPAAGPRRLVAMPACRCSTHTPQGITVCPCCALARCKENRTAERPVLWFDPRGPMVHGPGLWYPAGYRLTSVVDR